MVGRRPAAISSPCSVSRPKMRRLARMRLASPRFNCRGVQGARWTRAWSVRCHARADSPEPSQSCLSVDRWWESGVVARLKNPIPGARDDGQLQLPRVAA